MQVCLHQLPCQWSFSAAACAAPKGTASRSLPATFLVPPLLSSHHHQSGFSVFWGGCVHKWLQQKYVGTCLVFSAFYVPDFPRFKTGQMAWSNISLSRTQRGLCCKTISPCILTCNARNTWQVTGKLKMLCKYASIRCWVKISLLRPHITTSSSEKQWQSVRQGEHWSLIITKRRYHPQSSPRHKVIIRIIHPNEQHIQLYKGICMVLWWALINSVLHIKINMSTLPK